MHQPPIWIDDRPIGNLEKMLNGEPNSEEHWNAQWFALAYKNPARYVEKLAQAGFSPRIVVDYSGVLLAEMAKLSDDGTFDRLHVDGEQIGNVIALWRWVLSEYSEMVEFTGTAYSHCYFPATPPRDWELQITEWRRIFADLFGEAALKNVRGFWLPEMGTIGEPKLAMQLIRLLKKHGYEWLILPSGTLERPEGWTTPELENRVHQLVIEADGETETILCAVRDTEMGIRQQSGQNADGCINEVRHRQQVFRDRGLSTPPLVVPTSDGENGNVMMFEFFKNTFVPLFQNTASYPDVEFLTVSQYIDRYLPNGAETEVKLNVEGGSWIGGHQSWHEGDRRQDILRQVEELSREFAELEDKGNLSAEEWQIAKRELLLCETSCFVYWNSDFWFDLGEKFLERSRQTLLQFK